MPKSGTSPIKGNMSGPVNSTMLKNVTDDAAEHVHIGVSGWAIGDKVLWFEDDGWGGKNFALADLEYADVLLSRMLHVYRMRQEQAEIQKCGI